MQSSEGKLGNLLNTLKPKGTMPKHCYRSQETEYGWTMHWAIFAIQLISRPSSLMLLYCLQKRCRGWSATVGSWNSFHNGWQLHVHKSVPRPCSESAWNCCCSCLSMPPVQSRRRARLQKGESKADLAVMYLPFSENPCKVSRQLLNRTQKCEVVVRTAVIACLIFS